MHGYIRMHGLANLEIMIPKMNSTCQCFSHTVNVHTSKQAKGYLMTNRKRPTMQEHMLMARLSATINKCAE